VAIGVWAVTDEAETFLRLVAEAELRRAIELPAIPTNRRARRIRRPGRTSASDGLRRLQLTADALAWTGQLEPELAQSVVTSQELALVARRRIDRLMTLAPQPRPARAGKYRAISIGEPVTVLADGLPARIGLMTLVRVPYRAVLTLSVAPPGNQPDPEYEDFEFLRRVSAEDSRGFKYQANFEGACTGQLEFRPVLRRARWLDLTFGPNSKPHRISFNAPANPSAQFIELMPGAERYLDSVTEQLLRFDSQDLQLELADFNDIADVLTALRGVNAIGPDDPALRRLVTLARHKQIRLPAELAEVAVTDLPPSWRSVLDHAGAQDGPEGFAPVAAVLPELEGTRWVIAGLRSGATSAELRVLSWGVRRHPLGTEFGGFSWWARDSTGRWHFVKSSASSGEDHTDFELELTPAIDPAATTLDLILTGRSGQVTVTVPLDWKPL
jgi:hypothetical protein